MCFRAPFMDGVAFHDPMHEATKKPLTTVAACHCSPYSPGRQSRPHLFHVVRKVCTKSGHVSTIPPVVKNNSHHGISTIKSDYPKKGSELYRPASLIGPRSPSPTEIFHATARNSGAESECLGRGTKSYRPGKNGRCRYAESRA